MGRGTLQRLGRLVRHRVRDERDAHRAVPPDARRRLTERVAASETRHSGEIRICVESALPTRYLLRDATPRERAVSLFGKLRVWDTERNNGVLVYLLVAERAIEIVADRGLSSRVPDAEWARIVAGMAQALREGRFEQGLAGAVDEVTALLVRHFPLAPGEANANELPDEPALR